MRLVVEYGPFSVILAASLWVAVAAGSNIGAAEREEESIVKPAAQPTVVSHRHVRVEGVDVFYREAGSPGAPVVLLLHGFPSSSHQYRRLLETLGGRLRLIAPDYPGFGYSEAPLPVSAGGDFEYSFTHLTDVIEAFCDALGLERFVLYMFDFGGPVGLRLAERRPGAIVGMVVQNANAYDEGLSDSAREVVNLRPGDDGAETKLRAFFRPEITRWQYEEGASRPGQLSPDAWTLDQYFMDRPGRDRILLDLLLDYHTNIERYPAWQEWMREHNPPTLLLWGRNDPIFIEAGARAYLRDLPDAELHLFDTGHFALEEILPKAAPVMLEFVTRVWSAGG